MQRDNLQPTYNRATAPAKGATTNQSPQSNNGLSRAWANFVRWFDSDAVAPPRKNPDRVNVLRNLPFLAMHVACLAVFWVGWSWFAVVVCVALYLVRMFAITGFYHRYFSHRSFKTSRFWQFVFAFLGCCAVQRGPLWWAAHHRHHHRHSDDEKDVHSPVQRGFWWSHAVWFSCDIYFNTDYKKIKDFAKYPELRWLNRFDIFVPIIFATGLFGFGALLERFAPGLGTTGPQMLVWGFFISTLFLFHATFSINSLAHVIGSRRFQTKDQSRNNFWLAMITLGEGWHNNHHRWPSSVRQGFYWWEVDLTYYTLRVMQWLGVVWDLKGVPPKVYQEAARG